MFSDSLIKPELQKSKEMEVSSKVGLVFGDEMQNSKEMASKHYRIMRAVVQQNE